MYGSKEIKIALRKYIASTGNKTIDEQSVIDILDKGKDRDFFTWRGDTGSRILSGTYGQNGQ